MLGRWTYLAFAALLAVAAGCSPRVSWLDGQDRAEPLVQKARDKAAQGDAESAVRLYTAALDSNPKLAAAHLDLALLLHENEKERDYVRAIYHYQRYLDLRPTTEKKQMIEDRIRVARQMFAASIVRPERIAEDKAVLERENAELKAKMQALEAELTRLREEQAARHAAAARRVESERATAVSDEARPVEAEAAGSAAPPDGKVRTDAARQRVAARPEAAAAIAATNAPPARTAARTYVVKRGDTLSGIAAQCYGDRNKWRKIQDANRKVLGGSSGLKAGQVLTIP